MDTLAPASPHPKAVAGPKARGARRCTLHPKIDLRMMLAAYVPVPTGSGTIKDGTLPRIVQATMERIKPEGADFQLESGISSLRR